MSKYTRSNKINHYHDSSKTLMRINQSLITKEQQKQKSNNNFSRIRIASIITSLNGSGKCLIDDDINSLDSSSNLLGSESDLLPSKKKKNINITMLNIINKKKQQQQQQHSSLLLPPALNKQLAFFAFLILAILVICLEVRQVSSLNCYHCSSVDNPECDEPFTGRANFTETNCEKHIGQPAKVCRKIVQYIEDKKVVIRSCGYINDNEGKDRKPMCYKRSGTFAIMMESCNCYEDNCNHSASLVPSKSLLISALFTSSFGSLIMVVLVMRIASRFDSNAK